MLGLTRNYYLQNLFGATVQLHAEVEQDLNLIPNLAPIRQTRIVSELLKNAAREDVHLVDFFFQIL